MFLLFSPTLPNISVVFVHYIYSVRSMHYPARIILPVLSILLVLSVYSPLLYLHYDEPEINAKEPVYELSF